MAVDPALVGFDAVSTLQDTLLNYVMQNRMMQARDRQFNTQMQLERDRFEESKRRYDTDFLENQKRYDTNLGFKKRDEARLVKDRADYKLKGKADKAMLAQELNYRAQQQNQIDFDRRKREYDSQPLVKLGLIPDFDKETGLSRPKLPKRKLPSFYEGIPSFGLSSLFQPTETDILLNAQMQGLIQKGQ